jgi:hypothetical protein
MAGGNPINDVGFIHSDEEFLARPDFYWDYDQNLIVKIELLTEIDFFVFINDWKIYAKESTVLVDEDVVDEDVVDEDVVDEDVVDEDVVDEDVVDEDATLMYKKFIWPTGIIIEYNDTDSEKYVESFVEKDDRTIWVSVNGKTSLHRTLLSRIYTYIKQMAPLNIFSVCNCNFCKNSDKSLSYLFNVDTLVNLKFRYKKKIMCHNSGNSLRLDEVSFLEQPTIELMIVYGNGTPTDYQEEIGKRLRRPDWDFSMSLFDLNKPPIGFHLVPQAFKQQIAKTQIFIILVNNNLLNDNKKLEFIDTIMRQAERDESLCCIIHVGKSEYDSYKNLNRPKYRPLNMHPATAITNGSFEDDWYEIFKKLKFVIDEWMEEYADLNLNNKNN